MFRNQYFLSSYEIKIPENFTHIKFSKLHLYAHRELSTTVEHIGDNSLLLIGFIINPYFPEQDNQQILQELLQKCTDKSAFYKNIQKLGGRFVFLFKFQNKLGIVGDACCLRQIYYHFENKRFIATSSPKLYLHMTGTEWRISEEKKRFIESPLFRVKENSWYGQQTIDDRLRKCLPNHYVDINKNECKRIPFFNPGEQSENDILQTSAKILQGSISAAIKRFNLVQPVTAGWDTRMLLAASKKHLNAIQYYIFKKKPMGDNHQDVRIAQAIAGHLKLNFKIIHTSALTEEFKIKYIQEHIFPRLLPKTEGIQYHYYHHRNQNIININGNCGAIPRCHYGYSHLPFSARKIAYFSSYGHGIDFINSEIYNWYQGALKFAKNHKIPILDLFYWECRTGNWAATYPCEQDIAIEEFSPFNNRYLLFMQMLLPHSRRNGPQHPFFRKLIEYMWPDVLNQPINPERTYSRLSSYLKKSSNFRYLKKRFTLLL